MIAENFDTPFLLPSKVAIIASGINTVSNDQSSNLSIPKGEKIKMFAAINTNNTGDKIKLVFSIEYLGLTAQEVYEEWLANKDKPVVVEEVKELNMEEALKAVLAGDYQTLAYILYPEDFE